MSKAAGIIAVAVVLLGAGAWLYIRRQKQIAAAAVPPTGTAGTNTTPPVNNFPADQSTHDDGIITGTNGTVYVPIVTEDGTSTVLTAQQVIEAANIQAAKGFCDLPDGDPKNVQPGTKWSYIQAREPIVINKGMVNTQQLPRWKQTMNCK